MWQRFTHSSRSILLRAQQQAALTPSAKTVETEHLLLALLIDENDGAAKILAQRGITTSQVRAELAPVGRPDETQILTPPEVDEIVSQFQIDPQIIREIEFRLLRKLRGQSEELVGKELKLSEQVKKVLEFAADEAREMRTTLQSEGEIRSEHLVLGLLRIQECRATQILQASGLDLKTARAVVIEYIQAE